MQPTDVRCGSERDRDRWRLSRRLLLAPDAHDGRALGLPELLLLVSQALVRRFIGLPRVLVCFGTLSALLWLCLSRTHRI